MVKRNKNIGIDVSGQDQNIKAIKQIKQKKGGKEKTVEIVTEAEKLVKLQKLLDKKQERKAKIHMLLLANVIMICAIMASLYAFWNIRNWKYLQLTPQKGWVAAIRRAFAAPAADGVVIKNCYQVFPDGFEQVVRCEIKRYANVCCVYYLLCRQY